MITAYQYFGARYYDSELSVWLSVDRYAHLYPMLSPYSYVANNPVILYDPDGNIIALVVVSRANFPGAGPFGHMAILVGNDKIGYHIYSLELPTNDYIGEDEVVYEDKVAKPWSIVSKNYVLYHHKEDSYEDLLEYMKKNAPGADSDKGNGYDRIIELNNVTEEDEEAFKNYLDNRSSDDDFVYKFITNNCSSHSMKMINDFFGDIINDNGAIDIPNREFNKISKDTQNWTVLKDAKNPQSTQSSSIDLKFERKLILGSEGYEN